MEKWEHRNKLLKLGGVIVSKECDDTKIYHVF